MLRFFLLLSLPCAASDDVIVAGSAECDRARSYLTGTIAVVLNALNIHTPSYHRAHHGTRTALSSGHPRYHPLHHCAP